MESIEFRNFGDPRVVRGSSPIRSSTAAPWAAGAVTLLLLGVSSCIHTQEARRYRPDSEFTGRASEIETPRSWGRRVQHTWGREGEDLFPCLAHDRETLYYSTSRFSQGFNIVSKPVHEFTVSFLTTGNANDIHPAISPDGRTLAFASDREGSWSLFLLDTASGGNLRKVAGSEADTLAPRWSPDGKRIVCSRRALRGDRWEIWLVDIERETWTYLTEGLFPDWSPDGDWIVFQRSRVRGVGWYSLWKIRTDGSRLAEILSGRNDRWGAVRPVWSPDGKWIVFTVVGKSMQPEGVTRNAGEDLYVVSSDGTSLSNLTSDRSGISEWNPSFGADWRIYFSSDQDGSAHVWSIDSGLGEP